MSTTLAAPAVVAPRQYSRPAVLALWLAASAPMGVGAWVVAPRLADPATDPRGFAVALIAVLTCGLAWQAALVATLVAHEQRTLRWRRVRAALWLTPPVDRSGRSGGRRWLWAIPLVAFVGLTEAVPLHLPAPAARDFGAFLGSPTGQAAMRGNLGMVALVVAMAVLNTVLGEELLFRGLLLPRMRQAFGKADWVVNAVLFGLYHWHQPWSMFGAAAQGLGLAYATTRLRSAWLGIIAHSAQSLVFLALIGWILLS